MLQFNPCILTVNILMDSKHLSSRKAGDFGGERVV